MNVQMKNLSKLNDRLIHFYINHSIRGVLRLAFQMAVDDDLLLRNFFEFQLATIVANDSFTREVITQEQEGDF